jgi:Fe-S-cluster containining protein
VKKKKSNRTASVGTFGKLAKLYKNMADSYSKTAEEAGLSCADCKDNCCYSYFQHHTYIEWAYLWKGLNALPDEKREYFIQRAQDVVAQYDEAIAKKERPHVMCPLNEEGLCGLYDHRLMICRMHGTKNLMILPNGEQRYFQGCYRFREQVEGMDEFMIPMLNRTPFYQELAQLEMKYAGTALQTAPRVNLTLAEMIVQGQPDLT